MQNPKDWLFVGRSTLNAPPKQIVVHIRNALVTHDPDIVCITLQILQVGHGPSHLTSPCPGLAPDPPTLIGPASLSSSNKVLSLH